MYDLTSFVMARRIAMSNELPYCSFTSLSVFTRIPLIVSFAASVCQGALSLQYRSTNKFFIGVLLFIGCVLSLFHLLVESLSTSDLSGYDARPKRKAELQKQINIIRFTSELMMCVGLAAITMACNVDM